jgi:hypothetical protein
MGKNQLDGPAQQLAGDEAVVNLYVGRLS